MTRLRPDGWPAERKLALRILANEGPQPMRQLVSRLEYIVAPDRGLHKFDHYAEYMGTKSSVLDLEGQTKAGRRRIISSTLNQAISTDFFRRWVNDDDVTMIDLGPVARRYLEERGDAQSHQSPPLYGGGEGTARTDGGDAAEPTDG